MTIMITLLNTIQPWARPGERVRLLKLVKSQSGHVRLELGQRLVVVVVHLGGVLAPQTLAGEFSACAELGASRLGDLRCHDTSGHSRVA